MSGEGWDPIGVPGTPFSGGIDGAGFSILGFWIDRPNMTNVGLIGTSLGAKIKNIAIIIPEGKAVRGKSNVGALIGGTDYSSNKIFYNECFVSGNVTAVTDGAGGLHGYTSNNGGVEVVDCYTVGVITAVNKAGGLVGQGYRRIKVSSSYSTATIVTTGTTGGGLIGECGFPNGAEVRHDVEFSAAINPSIKAPASGEHVGRVVGFIKPNAGNGSGNYVFDLNYVFDQMTLNDTLVVHGTAENKNGLNKTASELKMVETFFGDNDLYWFEDVWEMGNEQYSLPILKNLSKDVQPKSNPTHLGGGSSIHLDLADKVIVSNTTNLLTIEGKTVDSQVTIYNTMGASVLNSDNASIDISQLATGIYLVSVQGKTFKIAK